MTLEEAKDIVLFSIIRGKEGYTSRCAECEKLVEAIGLVVVDMLEKMPSWISVKDRLPPCGERVLTTDGNAVFEAHLSISHKWVRCGFLWWGQGVVTHWMPLPDPPKECEEK